MVLKKKIILESTHVPKIGRPPGPGGTGKTCTFYLKAGEDEIVEQLCEAWGCNRSEAIRASISKIGRLVLSTTEQSPV